ncbi:MAG: penicillin-binding protein 1A [Gammaproteobacteria bacterium]|nr:penicillin-binding protein 1A [Gammaproteobacteria bacterium]
MKSRILTIVAALAASATVLLLSVIAGAYYYLEPALPSADTLRDIELQTPLRIYSRDGRLMAQIGEKRRTPVAYEDIPDHVVQAFLAAEDDRFFEHPGFDYQGITRAAINLLATGSRSQGGSTITQQLARVYFLTRERSFVRKAKELILAVQIENEFSKQEILALYLNKIFLGQRAYGVGAAAEVYFGKSLRDVNIAEAATIAGLPKAPSTLNPVSSAVRATERRAYVLRRMLELNFIDRDVYEDALALPMQSYLHGPKVELNAPYVTEMVRSEMVNRFGLGAYTEGYKVTTTIDSRLQSAAHNALRNGLLQYDRRHGFRGPVTRNIFADSADSGGTDIDPVSLDDEQLQQLLTPYRRYKDLHNAVVLNTLEDNSAEVYIQNIGRARLSWEQIKWRPYIDDNRVGGQQKLVTEMIESGDLILLLKTAENDWQLIQKPQVQAAFVALDPHDSAIIALVGGFDFFASKYNRAIQTKRQPGSSFKPFIYSAALEKGFTTATLINDAPVVFDDENLETAWRPENYSRRFNGPTRMREALVKSLNLVSVRILRGAGLQHSINHIKAFGLPDSALPPNLSLALGSGGASPAEVAGGYSVFANGGFRTRRYLIERVIDTNGVTKLEALPTFVCQTCNALPLEITAGADIAAESVAPVDSEVPEYPGIEVMQQHGLEWRPEPADAPQFFLATETPPERAISAENAYLIYDMMRDVIQRGTGRRARELGRSDIAGKTGTSNDRRDAWFSGYNGDIVATAWVGFDQDRSLGAGEEGGRTALPIWKAFMKDALADTEDATIPRPAGITAVRIVPETGLVAPAGYSGAIFELFRTDNIPEQQRSNSGSSIEFGSSTDAVDDEDIF